MTSNSISAPHRAVPPNSTRKPSVLLSIGTVGWSVSLFFLITYLLCIASGVLLPG